MKNLESFDQLVFTGTKQKFLNKHTITVYAMVDLIATFRFIVEGGSKIFCVSAVVCFMQYYKIGIYIRINRNLFQPDSLGHALHVRIPGIHDALSLFYVFSQEVTCIIPVIIQKMVL